MAPVSNFGRHQLGGVTTNLWRILLHAALSLCLSLTVFTTPVEARTEHFQDSWSELSFGTLAYERPFLQEPAGFLSLSPSAKFFSTSPAGRWSDRIRINIPDHPTIQRYIDFYLGKGRSTFGDALERSWYYVPVMADILESQGVPAEMVYVVLVESCFKKRASFRGAGGYWQLLASTARTLGLRVDRWVDERNDPVKSTQAAAIYLRSFYKQFNSWPMALAAYNAGGGLVTNAARNARCDDFWELSRRGRLPYRTRTYVPKVMAAMQVARDLEKHGFSLPRRTPVYDFEPIWIPSPLRLEQVAKWIDVPVDHLRDLNLSLRSDRMPPDSGFTLHLPSGARDKFQVAYDDYLRK